MKKNSKLAFLGRIPWLYLLIIAIWLLVLAIIANRYFNFQKYTLPFANSIIASDKPIIETSFYKLDLTNQTNSNSNEDINLRKIVTLDNSGQKSINLAVQVLYTSLGELHAIYNSHSGLYTLFFNQLPLSQINNPQVIYAFQLVPQRIVVIFAPDILGTDPIYTILDISPLNKTLIHEVGNYEQLISADIGHTGGCIYLKFVDARKYSEDGDYQVYQYCGNGNVTKILDVKPEDYYQYKFSKYSATQIMNQARVEHCFDESSHNFIMSRACNYGIKYCYMFRALKKSKQTRDYSLLSNACTSTRN